MHIFVISYMSDSVLLVSDSGLYISLCRWTLPIFTSTYKDGPQLRTEIIFYLFSTSTELNITYV